MPCVTPFLLLSRQHGMVKRWWMRSAAAAGPHHTETTIGYSNKEVDATASDIEDLSSEKLADFCKDEGISEMRAMLLNSEVGTDRMHLAQDSWYVGWQFILSQSLPDKHILHPVSWQQWSRQLWVPCCRIHGVFPCDKGTNIWQIHRGLQMFWTWYWRFYLSTLFQTSPIRCWKDSDWLSVQL